MKCTLSLAALAALLGLAGHANAAFLIEIDTDGSGTNAAVTYNTTNFSFGNNTGPAGVGVSAVSVASQPIGLTGNSIFGGGAPSGGSTSTPDTYIYTYTPGVDADNLSLAPNTSLNTFGDVASGQASGVSGTYRVYTAWLDSANIDTNNPTNYVLSDGVSTLLSTSIVQDNDSPGGIVGSQWVFLGEVDLTAGTTYTLTQTNTPAFTPGGGLSDDVYTNAFVSMRASGVLFDRVIPEPTTALLAVFGLAAAACRRR